MYLCRTNKYLKVSAAMLTKEDNRNKYKFELTMDDREKASLFEFDTVYSTLATKNREVYMKFVPKDAYIKLKTNMGQWIDYMEISREDLKIQTKCK